MLEACIHDYDKEGNTAMKEDKATVMSEVGPDLLEPPHILPVLMELFAGDRQQALAQQEQLFAHLAACQHCRTAVVVLLSVAQKYDHINNNPEEVVHNLLVGFATIDHKIEAHRYERLGAYAEAIAAQGRDKAAALFPDLAAHLSTCPDCRSMLEATIAFLIEAANTG